MGSRGYFLMGALFALLGLGYVVTDVSALFGWMHLGVAALWWVQGWRLRRRETALDEPPSQDQTPHAE